MQFKMLSFLYRFSSFRSTRLGRSRNRPLLIPLFLCRRRDCLSLSLLFLSSSSSPSKINLIHSYANYEKEEIKSWKETAAKGWRECHPSPPCPLPLSLHPLGSRAQSALMTHTVGDGNYTFTIDVTSPLHPSLRRRRLHSSPRLFFQAAGLRIINFQALLPSF